MSGTAGANAECYCGLPFTRIGETDYHHCENCDNVQEIETAIIGVVDGVSMYGQRVRTPLDQRYEAAVEFLKRNKWFPEQFQTGGAS